MCILCYGRPFRSVSVRLFSLRLKLSNLGTELFTKYVQSLPFRIHGCVSRFLLEHQISSLTYYVVRLKPFRSRHQYFIHNFRNRDSHYLWISKESPIPPSIKKDYVSPGLSVMSTMKNINKVVFNKVEFVLGFTCKRSNHLFHRQIFSFTRSSKQEKQCFPSVLRVEFRLLFSIIQSFS